MNHHRGTRDSALAAGVSDMVGAAGMGGPLRVLLLAPADASASRDTTLTMLARSLSAEQAGEELCDVRLVNTHRTGSRWARLKQYAHSMLCLGDRGGNVDTMLVQIGSLGSLWLQFVPSLVAARFYHRRLVARVCLPAPDQQLPIFGKLLRLLLSGADLVVTTSDWEGMALKRQGIDSTVIAPVLGTGVARTNAPLQPHLVVHIRRWSRSDLAFVLRAFTIVKQKYPRTELSIAVSSAIRSRVESFIRGEGLAGDRGVAVLGEDQMSELWTRGDICICSPADNSFPFDLTEAWRNAIPAIVPGFGAAASQVRDHDNGLIYSTSSSALLADRILELVESPDLVSRLSEHGRIEARRFSWSVVRSQWWRALSPSDRC
jgi:glycosyltransferase involved in cell wall biosynthesis